MSPRQLLLSDVLRFEKFIKRNTNSKHFHQTSRVDNFYIPKNLPWLYYDLNFFLNIFLQSKQLFYQKYFTDRQHQG